MTASISDTRPVFAVDLDDTLTRFKEGCCWDLEAQDNNQEPIPGAAACLHILRERGIKVVVFTSRKSCFREKTLEQLMRWGFEYDDIVFDKPQFDLLLDNKAMTASGTWNGDALSSIFNALQSNRELDKLRYPTFFGEHR